MFRVLFIIMLSLLCGCANSPPESNARLVYDVATGSVPIGTGYGISENDLIGIIANAEVFTESGSICGFQEEAQIQAFSELYDLSDAGVFGQIFEQSKGFSGQLYSLLGLHSLDDEKYLKYRNLVKDEAYVGYLSSEPRTSVERTSEFLRRIESGGLNKDIIYLSKNARKERQLRLLSYLVFIEDSVQGDLEDADLQELLSSASEFVVGNNVGSSIEWDVWQLCFSELVDRGDPSLFCTVFEDAEGISGQLYALLGLWAIDQDTFHIYSNKLTDGNAFIRIYGTDILTAGYENPEKIVNDIEKGNLNYSDVYVSVGDRESFRHHWIEGNHQ